ncbi:hypothetical protein NKI79_30230 [Mesorhizobium sp. M0340]|uniref:hypothetical protein n=1 Tax=Mesorhizobium sp. M0340 TaxID=2956939 RepID=UPI003337A7FC
MRYLTFVVESRRGYTFREGTIAVIAASSAVGRSSKVGFGEEYMRGALVLVPFFR